MPPSAPPSSADLRIGHGYDIHRLQPGGQLRLGGVTVADDVSAVAHSDGDVVLHALVDAILGAAGLGDIGEMFPNSDPQWKGADSAIFVERAIHLMRKAGYQLVNADVTILAERPRLGPLKPRIAQSIAALTGGVVNVKAGTNEGCDAVGRGEAVAAHVVVLLGAENAGR